MSNDGAEEGILPGQALDAVLGGKGQPKPVDDLEDRVRRAPLDPTTYDAAGLACARVVLEWLEQHPEDVGAPADNQYDWSKVHDGNGTTDEMVARMQAAITSEGLYDRIKRKDPDGYGRKLSDLELSGFLWGWGFNAAQRILKLPSRPNPAIVEIRI